MADKNSIKNELVRKIDKLIDAEQYKEAENLIKKALKHAKNPKEKSDLLICEGVVKFKRARLKDAIKLYQKALKINPDLENDPAFHLNIGSAYFEKGNPIEAWIKSSKQCAEEDLSKAEKHLRKSLELDNNNPFADDIYLNMGYISFTEKNYTEAKRHFLATTESTKSDIKRAEAYYMIGIILADEEAYEQSNRFLDECLKYLNDIDLIVSAHFHIGSNYYSLKKYDIAIKVFNKVFELGKKIKDYKNRLTTEYDTHFYLGNSYIELQNYKKAREHFSKALKLAKNRNDKRNLKMMIEFTDAKEKGLIKEE